MVEIAVFHGKHLAVHPISPFVLSAVVQVLVLQRGQEHDIESMAVLVSPGDPFQRESPQGCHGILQPAVPWSNGIGAEGVGAGLPEGVRGSGKTFQHRYQLVPFGRGFLRLALQTDTPIVPVGVVGGEESIISVYNWKGLARLLRGYAVTAAENNALWHERDISHSSTERVILPDATIVLDFMLHEMIDILDRLAVYPGRMQHNLDSMRGLVFSQPALLALVDAGMDRHAAYKVVQRHAHAALNGGPALLEALEADPEVSELVSGDTLRGLFDPRRQLTEVDEVFRRLGLLPTATAS